VPINQMPLRLESYSRATHCVNALPWLRSARFS
jgi:hypothetical protein